MISPTDWCYIRCHGISCDPPFYPSFGLFMKMPILYRHLFTLLVPFGLLRIAENLEMEKFRPIKADIVLAIDTAVGDVGRSPDLLDVEVIQHFLRKITMAIPLSPEGSRMAVVEFAASARIRLSLADGVDQKAVDNIYDDVSEWYDDEGIDRHGPVSYEAMFRRVHEDIFTGTDGDRPEVPNLLMVLTLVPSFPSEDPMRWRLRSRMAAIGSAYNYSNPEGVVITTSYATMRGTHSPKFTVTRGLGTFEPDAWWYLDFNDVLHYAVVHLRHALRNVWVDRSYTERQFRQIRTFDYTTCRMDTAFISAMPKADELKQSVGDIVFAIETDRSASALHHDLLRTLVLNFTRYLPISQNWIRFLVAEFDREANCRILTNSHAGADGCCMNQTSLFSTLIEKWAPQSTSRYRTLMQEFQKDVVRVDRGGSGSLINLRALCTTLQKALNKSGRIPQLIFVAFISPHHQPHQPASSSDWFRRVVKSNMASLTAGADALIVTSGNSNETLTYTTAVSPLSPVENLMWETQSFEAVRGRLFEFMVNVTKAAVHRCGRCYYNSAGQCVVDLQYRYQNASGIAFIDGRFCRNASGGVSYCPNERTCVNECERRPWSNWSMCWPPTFRKLISGRGLQLRHRVAINESDTHHIAFRFCPVQKRRCVVDILMLAFSAVPVLAGIVFG